MKDFLFSIFTGFSKEIISGIPFFILLFQKSVTSLINGCFSNSMQRRLAI